MKRFIQELQRRNVIKASISYLVVAWLILQVASITFPLLGISPVIQKWILILLAIGFPAWIVFAYVYELTPEGFKKTDEVAPGDSISRKTNKKLNAYIISGLTLVVIILLIDRFFEVNVSLESDQVEANSLAVLPFENLSESEDAYFARGITEDIFIQISNISDFRVLSSYTLKDYDANGKTLKEIGEELGVSHILLGNIRRSEDDIRVGCQLISTREESTMWADSYDRQMSSIFELQKEIAVEIAQSLMASFNPTEAEVQKPTENLVAYDLYLKARDLVQDHTGESQKKAAELYKEVILLDPYFANAYANLSSNYSLGIQNFGVYPKHFLDSAKRLAQKAVDLQPDYSGGWNALGAYYGLMGMNEQAKTMFQKTFSLNQNSSAAANNLAVYYSQEGEIDKGIELYKRAISLLPANSKDLALELSNLSYNYYQLGMYEEALTFAENALERRATQGVAYIVKALCLNALGDLTASQRTLNQALANVGENNLPILAVVARINYEYINIDSGVFYLQKLETSQSEETYFVQEYAAPNVYRADYLIKTGKLDSAEKLLDKELNFFASQMEKGTKFQGYLYHVASIHAIKGEQEMAIEWIEKLIDSGFINYPFLLESNLFEPLKDNVEFIVLMDQLEKKVAAMRQRVIDQEASEQLKELTL